MDPDENLRKQLRIARRVLGASEAPDDALRPDEWRDDATRLAELAVALHEWIVGRGFLPAAWQPKARPPTAESRDRLTADLAAILTGPTSGANAERLARSAAGDDADALARAMGDAARRYFGA